MDISLIINNVLITSVFIFFAVVRGWGRWPFGVVLVGVTLMSLINDPYVLGQKSDLPQINQTMLKVTAGIMYTTLFSMLVVHRDNFPKKQ